MTEDTRNVLDKYRGQSVDAIKADLDKTRVELHIAIENLERDFNMGTIVRTANAFNVHTIHIIGRRQWNKRGAMVTDAYMNIIYHASIEEFLDAMKMDDRVIVAMDIVDGARDLSSQPLPKNCVMIFGSEGAGISDELLRRSDMILQIEQFGSTRSINVGVAAGIAMYSWMQQHVLALQRKG
jgi:tRNA G18 (ribose-2'-O)-methylase SpoU